MSPAIFIVFSVLMIGIFLCTMLLVKKGADRTIAARDKALTPGSGVNAPPRYKPGPPLKKGKSALSPAIRWSLHFSENVWTLLLRGEGEIADTSSGDGFFISPNAMHDWRRECAGAPAHLIVSSGVGSIGRGAFTGMKLTSAEIAGSVKKIGPKAFENCDLKTLWLAEGVEALEENSFAGCRHLQTVYLPASLTQIHDAAFGPDPGLFTGLVIATPEGSRAAQWAADKGFTVQAYS